jgi:allene oxide cyclase-like protein
MFTIRTLLTGVTVVAAGAAGAAALAATDTASAGTAASSATSFSVRAHPGSDANIDLGDTGFSAGDEDLVVAPLTRGGTHVGRMVGNCTTVRVARSADQLCEFVLHLGRAQITASGTVRAGESGPSTFTLPILGGTGRYQGAAGQIAVTSTDRGTIPITVSLR